MADAAFIANLAILVYFPQSSRALRAGKCAGRSVLCGCLSIPILGRPGVHGFYLRFSELIEQTSDLAQWDAIVGFHLKQCISRHRGYFRVFGILNDGDAARVLDGNQPGRAVFKKSSKHYSDYSIPKMARRTAKQ